ncbi:hypothetical protein [Paramaledivibacter caminithermalis]|jgi:hypothetical protein|uniref:Uncharacterized protein n=1 Tax=Paramaledivibacter caminithermalis (strain DSM 15212 / CIP 107654 / DViRD3) TaxID=1121301 RepID=A0A1M6M1W9_PARC5|nr:hypothetical protein [Paramaledivibacter caminithermalis]SHJ77370.1 hypothetical protein SAMN02745912_01033 [Paramaledivibacter caminithermalis DSM 15212]
MNDIHLALAEELEKLAAVYRAKSQIKTDEISIQDISFVLSEKMKKGKITAIKALLKKYGAEKLVEVKPEDYEAIFNEAKRL